MSKLDYIKLRKDIRRVWEEHAVPRHYQLCYLWARNCQSYLWGMTSLGYPLNIEGCKIDFQELSPADQLAFLHWCEQGAYDVDGEPPEDWEDAF